MNADEGKTKTFAINGRADETESHRLNIEGEKLALFFGNLFAFFAQLIYNCF